LVYEVKVRRGRTIIPKELRHKYGIKEGDTILFVDVGDHMTVLPVPRDPLRILEGLKIEEKGPVYEIRREALKTARKLVEEKLRR
jgi:AbrB family looped-hinge helix DNA binding protein